LWFWLIWWWWDEGQGICRILQARELGFGELGLEHEERLQRRISLRLKRKPLTDHDASLRCLQSGCSEERGFSGKRHIESS